MGTGLQAAGYGYLVGNGLNNEAARALVAGQVSSPFPFPSNLAVAQFVDQVLAASDENSGLTFNTCVQVP